MCLFSSILSKFLSGLVPSVVEQANFRRPGGGWLALDDIGETEMDVIIY